MLMLTLLRWVSCFLFFNDEEKGRGMVEALKVILFNFLGLCDTQGN